MKNLVLFGSGGHALSCLDVIDSTKKFKIKGLISENKNSKNLLGIPIIGNNSNFHLLKKKYNYAFIGVGMIKNNKTRLKIYSSAKNYGFIFPSIISKYSYVSKSTSIGEGTIIMHNCVVNADSIIGKNCIINTSSIIEHNTKIGDNSHVAPGATVLGHVKIGSNTFIGSGAVLKNGITIGSNCVIQAGSFIKKDLKSGTTIKK